MTILPTTVVSKRRGIGSGKATTTAPTTATTTTATPATAAVTAAAATAVANHLSKTGINLLLGLSEDIDQVTSLLRVWKKKNLSVMRGNCNDKQKSQ